MRVSPEQLRINWSSLDWITFPPAAGGPKKLVCEERRSAWLGFQFYSRGATQILSSYECGRAWKNISLLPSSLSTTTVGLPLPQGWKIVAGELKSSPSSFPPQFSAQLLLPLSPLLFGVWTDRGGGGPHSLCRPLLFRRKSATYDGRALKCFKNWEKERRGGDRRIGKEEKGLWCMIRPSDAATAYRNHIDRKKGPTISFWYSWGIWRFLYLVGEISLWSSRENYFFICYAM